MNQTKLNRIVEKHEKWLNDEEGERADLRSADLRSADLQGADLRSAYLDYSCWPLWCGSIGVRVDRKIYLQLLAHLCAVDIDDHECKAHQQASLELAKQSHRADEMELNP